MDLGKKISDLRKKRGLTQEALAERLNISRQTLANWEASSTSPSIVQARELSELFDISLDDLLDLKTEVACKKDSILRKLVGTKCYLDLEDTDDYRMDYKRIYKIIEVNNSFLKVEFIYNKKTITKLLDLDLVASIEKLEEE